MISNSTRFDDKLFELCRAILEDPEFQALRPKVETFFANPAAQEKLARMQGKGEELQRRQMSGERLSAQEIAAFEDERDALFEEPVIRGFFDAQQLAHRIQARIHDCVGKTFELGRVPTEEDLKKGECCGDSGCGCH
ncbi:MAG: YlbF family regulator [Verrucomicrobiia bacterium]